MESTYRLLKLFSTASGYYAYDGATGRILTISPQLIRESGGAAEAAILRYLLTHHMVSVKPLPDILWEYDFSRYLEMIKDRIPALLLQITRRCNLNCDYCVYSGNYTHVDPHADQDMTEDILHQSIDFFAAHSSGRPHVTIDFYGGEALLRFDQVKEAVRYAKYAMPNKAITFRITSNGVLLNKTVAQFLDGHPDVQIMLTINGPYHDRHRKDWAGNGSLSQIMHNIREVRDAFSNVWEKQIHFIANVAHGNHLPALLDFYREEVGKPPNVVTRIRGTDANDYIDKMLSEESGTEIEETLRRTYCKRGDPYLEPCFGRPVLAAHERRIFQDGDAGYIGSCMPPLEKLFVHADGNFGICESSCDKVCIGNLEDGFDLDRLRQIYDYAHELFQRQCRNCWAQRLCTVCLKDAFEPTGAFLKNIPEGFCRDSKQYALNQLRMYCEIANTQPMRLESGKVDERHR